MANAAEAAEVGLDVLKMVWSNVRTAVSLPGQVRTTVMEFLHRLFPRMRFEAHLFHELGARVARAATAMLCAAAWGRMAAAAKAWRSAGVGESVAIVNTASAVGLYGNFGQTNYSAGT